MLGEMLEKSTRGIDDVVMALDALWTEVEAGDHRGCLAANTSTELPPRRARRLAPVSLKKLIPIVPQVRAPFESKIAGHRTP